MFRPFHANPPLFWLVSLLQPLVSLLSVKMKQKWVTRDRKAGIARRKRKYFWP
ncbi:hypothetical protein HMPREF0262_00943 [Clostridium sp. ATCC 29733]|nr:hypothetical protein HMPREF0262_00943 [Clostridium sp. ATCC 29733]